MNEAKRQSLLQGGLLAGGIVAVIFIGITYVQEGAVNWRTVWVVLFIVSLPWLIYAAMQ